MINFVWKPDVNVIGNDVDQLRGVSERRRYAMCKIVLLRVQ